MVMSLAPREGEKRGGGKKLVLLNSLLPSSIIHITVENVSGEKEVKPSSRLKVIVLITLYRGQHCKHTFSAEGKRKERRGVRRSSRVGRREGERGDHPLLLASLQFNSVLGESFPLQ